MATLKDIRDTVIIWIEDDSEPDTIDSVINSQLRYLTKTEFEGLRKTVDITPDSDGKILLPPRCNFILGIYQQTAYGDIPSFNFMSRSARQVGSEPRTNRYLYHPAESTTTASISGLVMSGDKGEYTLTEESGTAVTTDMIGKELKIAGDSTKYIVTDAVADTELSVYPAISRSSASDMRVSIEPIGSKQYILTSPDGTLHTSTVTVDYQTDHPPLIDDDSEVLVPMERTLALSTVQQFLNQSKYDVDAARLRGEILEAKLVEYSSEPSSMQDNAPKDTMFAYRSRRGNRMSSRR